MASVARSLLFGALLLGALGGCRTVLEPRVAAPRLDPRDDYDALLGEVVSEDGYVDYDALRERRAPLDAFVAWLAQPRSPRPEAARHAFWLNAYNALVLYGALEDGAATSVWERPGWFGVPGVGFFVQRAFLVDGRPISLWEIEHELLRFRLLDPRDHAALNCASRGCPPLRSERYREPMLDLQLDDQMRRWLADPERGLRVEGETLWVSKLLHTFRRDVEFASGGLDLCTALSVWAEPALATELRRRGAAGCAYEVMLYDRALNHAPGTARGVGGGPVRERVGPSGDDTATEEAPADL